MLRIKRCDQWFSNVASFGSSGTLACQAPADTDAVGTEVTLPTPRAITLPALPITPSPCPYSLFVTRDPCPRSYRLAATSHVSPNPPLHNGTHKLRRCVST